MSVSPMHLIFALAAGDNRPWTNPFTDTTRHQVIYRRKRGKLKGWMKASTFGGKRR